MIRQEGSEWVLFSKDGTKELGRFSSREEAEAREQEILRHVELQAASRTSESLDERPFLIDDVELDESQIRSVANLVGGRSRRGPRAPLELRAAVDLWRRHNHVVTEGGRRRWRVHSASPTFREAGSTGPVPLEWELLEAVDPEGAVWEICLIRSGWSQNGRYYPADVLERALPLFEGVPIAIYGWEGGGHLPVHIRQAIPDGLAANIVGWVEGVHGLPDAERYEVRASFHCVDAWTQSCASAWSTPGGRANRTCLASRSMPSATPCRARQRVDAGRSSRPSTTSTKRPWWQTRLPAGATSAWSPIPSLNCRSRGPGSKTLERRRP
ncbi:MAG: hypothetical protein HY319_06405 [Armatimonadetes bacterium]|nr:hypothetical protein [Armatimonadota bacterium]